MQFLPIKLPPVHGPPFFYKSIHIALHENHRGNCSGLMVPISKILGIGSPPTKVDNDPSVLHALSENSDQTGLVFRLFWL